MIDSDGEIATTTGSVAGWALPIAGQVGTNQNSDPQAQPPPNLLAASGPEASDLIDGFPQQLTAAPSMAGLIPGLDRGAKATLAASNAVTGLGQELTIHSKSKAPTLNSTSPHSMDASAPISAEAFERKPASPEGPSPVRPEHAQHAPSARTSGGLRSDAQGPVPQSTGSVRAPSGLSQSGPTQIRPTAPTDAGADLSAALSAVANDSTSQLPALTSASTKPADQLTVPAAAHATPGVLPITVPGGSPASAAPGWMSSDPLHVKELVAPDSGVQAIGAGAAETTMGTRSDASPDAHTGDARAALRSTEGEQQAAETVPGLTHARLVQSLAGSQMQVSLRSEDFGKVTVHAGYGRDALSAQISLENPQLGAALSSHIPAMEQKLAGEHGLRTSVVISTGPDGQGTQNPSKDASAQPERNASSYKSSVSRTSFPGSMEAAAIAVEQTISPATTQASAGRLNIRI